MQQIDVIIAGGGTGGHVYPALAIADALVADGCKREAIHFVGSARALEARLVPDAGYSITLLPGRGIKRKLSPDNLGAVYGLVVAFFKAVALLKELKPKVVLSVGGYAAAPAAFAAAVLRIPLVIAESNAVPGATNRLVARFAKACAVAYPETPLPKSVWTGNPVRPEIVAIERTQNEKEHARTVLGIEQGKFVIASFGGSLGARKLNRVVADLSRTWNDRDDVFIYQVVGSRDWKDVHSKAQPSKMTISVEYENHMALLYAAADVVVCRSGATTAAEVATSGTPAIFVPLPFAPGDHQTANARALESTGAAIIISDGDLTVRTLRSTLDDLIDHPERLVEMTSAAKSTAKPNAAHSVADILLGFTSASNH